MNSNRGSYLLGAALGTAFVLALGSHAMAGEDIYYGGGGLKGGYDVPPPPPSDRGLYFKAYIGQSNTDVGNIWTPGYETNTFSVFHKDIKSNALYGLGIGYKRNRWLRFDLTGEYRGDTTFLAQDSYPAIGGGTAGTNEYTADVSSWLGLANAYWDIATWCGFTPYVGAGIGFATISVNGLKDVNVPNNSVFYAADGTNTNFAWAIHAGVAYDVSPQLAIDLAYRYADLGNAASGVVTAFDNSSSYSHVAIRDITTNDVMLGLRYKLHREQPVMYPVK
jgi:opacity protein-like surface antigen